MNTREKVIIFPHLGDFFSLAILTLPFPNFAEEIILFTEDSKHKLRCAVTRQRNEETGRLCYAS